MRRTLTVLAMAGGVFATVFALTFPTDTIVRWAVARATPSGATALVFGRARLRVWGFQLEDVVFRRPDGSALASAEWLTFRPSLRGLFRDRTGRPWHARAGSCGGTLDALLDRDAGGDVVTLEWKDVDLAHCPSLPLPSGELAGRADGGAELRPSPTTVDGHLEVRAGSWSGVRRFGPLLIVLHADPASLRWSLAGDRLALTEIALHGPDLEVRGAGTVRLAGAIGQSRLDLDITVAPGNDAPPLIRTVVDQLPPGPGATMPRHVAVTGTVDAPRIVGLS